MPCRGTKPSMLCLCFLLQPHHPVPQPTHRYFSRLPRLALAQILLFLDSGSLHVLMPLPEFPLVPILQLIPICLQDSSVTCSQQPPWAPCSSFPLAILAALLHTGPAVCGFKAEARLEPASPPALPPSSRSCSRYVGPRQPCPSDQALFGLHKAWIASSLGLSPKGRQCHWLCTPGGGQRAVM